MTNKERYKEAFGVLRQETEFLEVEPMKKQTITVKRKRLLALVAVVAVLLVAAVGAYAADVGGIRKTIQAWGHGTAYEISVSDNENGGYDFHYTDENGNTFVEQGVSGVEIDENGNERPLLPEEILDENGVDVMMNEQGRVMLYYRDKVFDVTDALDETGSGKVRFKESDKPFSKTVYLTITGNNPNLEPGHHYGIGCDRPSVGKDDYIWLGE